LKREEADGFIERKEIYLYNCEQKGFKKQKARPEIFFKSPGRKKLED